jgi:cytochrome P450
MQLHDPNALLFIDGPLHVALKKILQKPFLPDALRPKINTLETIILENMASWEQREAVNGMSSVRKVEFSIMI